MSSVAIAAIFCGSAALLGYTFVGYRFLIAALPKRETKVRAENKQPSISVIVVAHNEAGRIHDRIQNLLASEYPADLLRVFLITDGCTDDTAKVARRISDSRVCVVEHPERRGKPHGLNLAVAQCSSELIVFTDARQTFSRNTIARLAARFSDPAVGAVSGDLQIENAASGVGRAVDRYWKWEKSIRRSESRFDSCIGCTGAVYAIRRELFRPIPEDTILDDVVIPMQIALQGYRVIHEDGAVAFDPQSLEPHREKLRKKRTLAGNFQMLCRYPSWLLPWQNRLWWQLLSHKYLRLVCPLLLLITLFSSAALAGQPLFLVAFWGQCLFYVLAIAGLAFPRLRFRVFSLPAGFVFLNARIAAALMYYVQMRNVPGWSTPRT